MLFILGQDTIQAIGLYKNGLPDGPFWIFTGKKDQFVQVHFKQGELIKENTILIDFESEWALMGNLVNRTYLSNAKKIDLDWVGEYHCLTVIRIPETGK